MSPLSNLLLLILAAFLVYASCDEIATTAATETSPNPVPSSDATLDEFGSKTFKEVVAHYRAAYPEPVSDEDFQEVETAALALDSLYKQDNGRAAFATWTTTEERERFSWKMCISLWGRFCGPGYCDGGKWDNCSNSRGNQLGCNFRGSIKDSVDSCCREHDKCCVYARAQNGCSHCRSSMVSCLDRANTSGFSEGAMRIAMKTFFKSRSGCC
uniref:Phospholipase A2 n=1 Tax=Percolomonas cosmopolitus TaxID=63605 RepID=A0A7S1PH74_9EUKA|eukprot:CAMPEP_0117442914 /NCGR_PEP_ID=MMETSP0759-20121206/4409_1 /TAXON_ID=63605 /ORGANISM="Percolomonas cosmopolitus, Strain WS" /LENGTH=212 /DNA_ID=CAMNT_0005234841 /DNA_START=136 /DNA_END=774 /DNA_ORIENTATION=+